MKAIRQKLGPRAVFNEPMSRHTTLRVGGPALCLARVESAAEAGQVRRLALAEGLPLMALGKGSNLLVSDAGFQGVMLRLSGPLARVRLEGPRLFAGGGALLGLAVKTAAEAGLAGLAWAAGIPATVGGALANNAGAFGGDMASIGETLFVLHPDGREQALSGREVPSAYRRRELPAESLLLGLAMKLSPDSAAGQKAAVAANLARRKQSQPKGAATAGSVFKNPPGGAAGRLIEQAGCKGLAVGGAVVSRRHANFIENAGRATAADIKALMGLVSGRVLERFGVALEPEVQVVGDV